MPNDDTGDQERTGRPAPGSEGFTESTLRDATLTGTSEDPEPPAEPKGAAFPRRDDDTDDDTP